MVFEEDMKVYATSDYDGTYIYDPQEWGYINTEEGGSKFGDFTMEISEEDLEKYRKHKDEEKYWNDRIDAAKQHDGIMKTGGYGPGKWNE
jgi:hypothetical protein